MIEDRTTTSGLVAAAIAGDRDALRELWRTHRGWVSAIVLAHMPRGSDLEDLVQAVALQLVTKVVELREPEAFKPWLRSVAANTARAAGRRVTRRRRLSLLADRSAAEAFLDRAPPDASDSAARSDEATRVLTLARSLPEEYREPLLLRCVRGMSYRQIGAVLDLPETTIETRIVRARRMLRELADRPPSSHDDPTAQTAHQRSTP